MVVMFLAWEEKSNFSYGIFSKWSLRIIRIRSRLLFLLVTFNVDCRYNLLRPKTPWLASVCGFQGQQIMNTTSHRYVVVAGIRRRLSADSRYSPLLWIQNLIAELLLNSWHNVSLHDNFNKHSQEWEQELFRLFTQASDVFDIGFLGLCEDDIIFRKKAFRCWKLSETIRLLFRLKFTTSIVEWLMNMEQSVGWELTWKSEVLGGKLPQCCRGFLSSGFHCRFELFFFFHFRAHFCAAIGGPSWYWGT
jgi:hypothetical protein